MEALDCTKEQRLRIAVAIAAIKTNLPFSDYKKLAEWLGCYRAIKPDYRSLHPAIINYLVRSASSASRVFEVWLLCDLIESTLHSTEQSEIVKWMNA